MKVAILDDYQNVALELADWSGVRRHAEITVFTDHLADPSAVVERLRPFDVVCVMRERTPLPSDILKQLPNLRLIASTGPRNASIDTDVFDDEPLAPDHPFRKLENVLATPHIGYVTEDLYRTFYGDAAANITKWLEANATSA